MKTGGKTMDRAARTVRKSSMRTDAFAVFAACCATVVFADTIYTEVPADVSAVVVGSGVHSMGGLPEYREHLKQYWKFDDADNVFSNSVGALSLSAISDSTVTHKSGDDSKIGGGAVWTDKGFKASENIIDGKSSFTIMFWFKKSTWSAQQETLVYIGQTPPKDDTAAIVQATRFLRLSFGNRSDGVSKQLYLFENQRGSQTAGYVASLGTSGQWNHIALACSHLQQEGAVATNMYTVYVNGNLYFTWNCAENNFTTRDYLYFGNGWHHQGGTKPIGDGTFDELMIYDTALDSTAIAAIKDHTQPFEFSADWLFPMNGGTLDLYGGEPQTISGYGGTLTNGIGITLAPSRSATFAGEISGESLTLDAASATVTQTLAGANSYLGATHIKSGVLAVNPLASFPSLESDLVAYWSCDSLSDSGKLFDMSGNGNHLTPSVGRGDASIDPVDCLADGSLRLPRTGDEVGGFSRSSLTGFDAGVDNSYTVALWQREDQAYYREGSFRFGDASGMRFNGNKGNDCKGAYFGDLNYLVSFTFTSNSPDRFGDGKWRHLAVAYDSTKANGADYCYFVYTNGALAVRSKSFNSNLNHATQKFNLGIGIADATPKSLKGNLDDVVVLKGVSADDIAKLYSWRRGQYETENVATVLPETTQVTIDAGATLFLTNANEKVRSLAGAGTIYISAGSTLEVHFASGFTGAVLGDGKLIRHGLRVIIK